MQAVVTGCAGFIGSHLTEALLAAGHRVVGIDSLSENYSTSIKLSNLSNARDLESFTFIEGDVASDLLPRVVGDADVVFHLAGEPGVRTSWGSHFSSYLRNNVLATQQLLEALRDSPARVVFASSSSVYGQAQRLPTPEVTIPRPFSPYGVTKLAAEHLCQLYAGNYGLDVVCLRYFSVFGPRQRPDMAFHRFCRAALERTPLTVLGDGSQMRDFTSVSDIIKATVAAGVATTASAGIYNIGAGSQVSLVDAIETLESIVGRPLDVRFTSKELGDVAATGADIANARRDLDYVPLGAFEDGLRDELEWVERNLPLLV